ncbi:hypothetical protein FRC06_006977, partial [Ceratobasidium sp. 370]
EYSGAIPIADPYYQEITLCCDVRPDTPEPEEPELNAEGRYTTQAKGKGRPRG